MKPSLRKGVPSFKPCLETLEERCLLSGGAVNVTSMAGLASAINAANSSDSPTTITLAPDTTFDLGNSTIRVQGQLLNDALPVITGDITIVGNGDTFQRTSGAFRFFTVQGQGASLTLQDLTLQGGLVQGTMAEGGAVYGGPGTTLNLSGVTVRSNEAVGFSGIGYSAEEYGPTPGDSAYGGGIYVNGGSLTLTNDIIENNKAVGGNGGNGFNNAVDKDNGDNGGAASGGGVYVSASAQLTIVNTSFSSNTAEGGNGGAAADQTDPIAVVLSSGKNYYNGGSGGAASGGGLYAATTSLTLTGVSFANDTAVGGQGGSGGRVFVTHGYGPGGGSGGSATGGGVGGVFSSVSTLIDTVFTQDTVTGGAAAPQGNTGGYTFPSISGPAVTLSTATLPSGTVGTPYSDTITALPAGSLDSNPTLSVSIIPGSIQDGLTGTISGNVLTISGTPTAAGTVSFSVTAITSDGSTAPLDYKLTTNPLPGGGGTGTGGGSGGGVSDGNDTGSGGGVGGGNGIIALVDTLMSEIVSFFENEVRAYESFLAAEEHLFG